MIYADDIVIISLSSNELQSSLDILDEKSNSQTLEVNKEKTKCITFQKKNKKNKINHFYLGNKTLKKVAEFNYLSFLINTNVLFKHSKSQQSNFSLNNRAKLKSLSLSSALRLIDALILSILKYRYEVQGAFYNVDFKTWNISS